MSDATQTGSPPEPALNAARARLFVALDLPTGGEARRLVERLGDTVTHYKIGLELLFARPDGGEGGLALATSLARSGKRIFLDMKLLDIPNTVESATRNIAALGVDYLTVHGHDRKTLDAAVRGRGSSPLKLLAVTVLTSIDARDLAEQGIHERTPAELVIARARAACEAGFDGVIASGREAAAVCMAVHPGFHIVTPGIRRPGESAGDQSRVTTPGEAIGTGASHIVVGRSITASADPLAAARACLADIAAVAGTSAGP